MATFFLYPVLPGLIPYTQSKSAKSHRLADFSAPGLVIFPNAIMRHIAGQGFLRGTRVALGKRRITWLSRIYALFARIGLICGCVARALLGRDCSQTNVELNDAARDAAPGG
jgi:hypothetical protein